MKTRQHDFDPANNSVEGLKFKPKLRTSKLVLFFRCLLIAICIFGDVSALICIYWFVKFGWFNATAFMFNPLIFFSWLIYDTIKYIRGDKQ